MTLVKDKGKIRNGRVLMKMTDDRWQMIDDKMIDESWWLGEGRNKKCRGLACTF
jgi:hypothetical protein